MKIIKVSSKNVVNKKGKNVGYEKFILNLPKKIVEESGFFDKDLNAEIKDQKIIISVQN